MYPITLSATSINGTEVLNRSDESLGDIKDLMINTDDGQIAYVVLSHGGFLGIGDKLFAIPWEAFRIDRERKKFILDVTREKLAAAPGFDKDNWPNSASHEYLTKVYDYFGYRPYWKKNNVPIV